MEGMFRNLGLALSLLRELKGLNQVQLARQAGVGKSQLSKYENSRELPKLDSLERILRVLQLSPVELFHTLDLIDQRERELAAHGELERNRSLFPVRGLLSEDTDRTFSRLAADLLDLYTKVVQDRLRPEMERLAKARKPGPI